jgi:hypothetical protein
MDSKFIARYRRAIQKVEADNASLDLANKLKRSGYRLVESLKRDFEQSPGSQGPYNLLKATLRECLQLEEISFRRTRAYMDALPPTLHDAKYDAVRDVYGAIEDVIAGLLLLLLDNWQETEAPERSAIQVDWRTAKPVATLVRSFARFSAQHTLMQRSAKPLDTPAPVATPAPGAGQLSLRQVALLHVYEGKVIPKAADAIAQLYGHKSGAKLYAHYLTVSQRAGRTGVDIAGQKLAPMIKDIAAVIDRLTGSVRQLAESELQTLEARR